MSHLDFIVSKVRSDGSYEERWHVLLNGYFRGDDGFEQIEAWAKANNLIVSFSDEHRTCTFQAAPGLAK